jgi:hypothetical protein
MKRKRWIFTSVSRRTLPPPLDKHVRYHHPPLPPGWITYRITIPAGKDRPD